MKEEPIKTTIKLKRSRERERLLLLPRNNKDDNDEYRSNLFFFPVICKIKVNLKKEPVNR